MAKSKHEYDSRFSAMSFASVNAPTVAETLAYVATLKLSKDAGHLATVCELATVRGDADAMLRLVCFLAVNGAQRMDTLARDNAKPATKPDAATIVPATREGIAGLIASLMTGGPAAVTLAPQAPTEATPTVATGAAPPVATDTTGAAPVEQSDALSTGRVVKRERAA